MPFNKPKAIAGVIIQKRKPDAPAEEAQDADYLESCANDIISAVESKDSKALASALRDAFMFMDSVEDAQEGDSE